MQHGAGDTRQLRAVDLPIGLADAGERPTTPLELSSQRGFEE